MMNKNEIDKLETKRIKLMEEIKRKTTQFNELEEEKNKIQEKKNLILRNTGNLQENIVKFAKFAAKSQLNLKGTDLLQKEDVYHEMVSNYDNLVNRKY